LIAGQLAHRTRQLARALGLGAIERVEQHVEMFCRRRHVRDDLAVEGDDADAVPLPVREVRQARGEIAAVFQLGHLAALEPHRFRDVEEDAEVGVRVRFVLFHVEAVGAREQAPVDAADVVAGNVAAVLGEVDRRSEIGRAVETVDEAVDDRPREQVEIADPREDRGIDEPRAGHPAVFSSCHVGSQAVTFPISASPPPRATRR
jgi:hypothetical protein